MQITRTIFPSAIPKEKNVAAYARVSADKDAMHHSLSAQISRYSTMIQSHPGWRYIGVYADEAMTGTKDSRADFQRMLADCRAGKIDMIITKSISRFARNTVVLLTTVRELKDIGVDVFFEEQNIHTLSSDGELMLSILAGFAEEESLSVSQNMRWRVRKNFSEGIPWNGTVLGYRLRDGKFEIEPTEAETVRRIYSEYLSGKGLTAIANGLNADKVKTRFGREWHISVIRTVLQNYIYTGNLILQSTYRQDHICKTATPNNGELPKYLVEDSHEAIISMEDYEAVQTEMKRRTEKYNQRGKPHHKYPFSSLITCEHCGKHYRRRINRTGPVWICPTYNNKGKSVCPSKMIPEITLLDATFDVDLDLLDGITACDGNVLILHFKDGSEQKVVWQDRSRRESWTDEMKRQASERSKRNG